jgi:MioC protein
MILYGSSGGTAESVAQALGMEASDLGWSPTVQALDTVDPGVFDAAAETTFLFCTSTAGAGDLPENARRFFETLAQQPRYLGSVRYGLLGLGDEAGHPQTFCGAAHLIDKRLQDLGAQRLGPPLLIDTAQSDQPKNRSWRPLADAGKQAMARVSELFWQLRSSYLLGDRATSKKPVTHRQLEP